MTHRGKPAPHKEQVIQLVKSWLDRSGLTINDVLTRLQVWGCDISRSTFENNFTTRIETLPNVSPTCILALVAAFIEGLPSSRQCTAAEALHLATLTRLPLDQLEPLSHLFNEAEFEMALRRYYPIPEKINSAPPRQRSARSRYQEDWRILEPPQFFGRQTELNTLNQWVMSDQCRVVAIFGMGGMGKSTLAAKLGGQIKGQFDYAIWQSLQSAPPPTEVFRDWLQLFPNQQLQSPEGDLPQQLTVLLKFFNRYRCLLVLDNLEAVLGGPPAGEYRAGYEGYGRLLYQLATTAHRSCLILTSRETPKELATLVESPPNTRQLLLNGLAATDAEKILRAKGVAGESVTLAELTRRYSGNPLALYLTAKTIEDLFAGDVALFLAQEQSIFGNIRELLEQQFERLQPLEQEVLYWLALEQEDVPLALLTANFAARVTPPTLLETLQTLRHRFLIESSPAGFSLQNVIAEYTISRLVQVIAQELLLLRFDLFKRVALSRSQTKTYIRQQQLRLIITPLLEQLLSHFGHKSALIAHLKQCLSVLMASADGRTGYAAANLIALFSRLDADVDGLDFSRLAVWQADLQQIRLRNVNFRGADLSGSTFRQPFESVWSLAFTPDGQILVGGLENGEIRLWRVSDGQQTGVLLEHKGYVWSVAFSPDGQLMASAGNDGLVRLWDTHYWQWQRRLVGHTTRCREVAFSYDGRWLASAGEDQTVRIWAVTSGECRYILEGEAKQFWSVAFHPQSNLLAASGLASTIQIWNAETGQLVSTLSTPADSIRRIAFSPDGQWLAGGGNDGQLYLWQLSAFNSPQILTGHTDYVRDLAFSPDGTQLVSGDESGHIRFWHLDEQCWLKSVMGHEGRLWCLAFSPNGEYLASSGDDKTIRFWDATRHNCLKIWPGHANRVQGVAFSPNGRLLAGGLGDATVQLWDIETKTSIKTLRGHTDRVWTVAFSPDGGRLASGSYDKSIKLWDQTSGQCQHTLIGHTDWVRQLLFSPDGQLLISSSDDHTLRLWQVATGACVQVLTGHTGWVWGAALSPNEQLLASGSADETVRLWRIDTGECIQVLAERIGQVCAVAFSPDGQWLASSGHDRLIRLWNMYTNRCDRVLAGHTDKVWSVTFSPDGQQLISGSEDQTARVWDVQNGDCLHQLAGHTSLIISTAVHPDGHLAATGSLDASIKLWNLLDGNCLDTLPATRPYEGLNISDVTGLTATQKKALIALGAVDRPGQN